MITHRKATAEDIPAIVLLLANDRLGASREKISTTLNKQYIDAFNQINNDHNHYLMVIEMEGKIVATCHLMLMPSLTFTGSVRMHIEAVRVHPDNRGQGIGQYMIKRAITWGTTHGATIVQLTTNKERPDAVVFYEKLGFKATHEGMKLQLELP